MLKIVVVASCVALASGVALFDRGSDRGAVEVHSVGLSPKDAQPPQQCADVGRRPSMRVHRVSPGSGMRLLRPPIVVACGNTPAGGRMEVVAFRVRGFSGSGHDRDNMVCISTDTPGHGISVGEFCQPPDQKWLLACEGQASCTHCGSEVCVNEVYVEGSDGYLYTAVTGRIGGSVSKVVISFTRGGLREHAEALVPPESSRVKAALGVSERIGFFATALPACVSASTITIRALDQVGSIVGRAKGFNLLGEGCQGHSSSNVP
jgi:hypothetical protein